MKKNIVILGGGVIGLCSAHYLSEVGHHVTVIDKDDPLDGLNCSMGNQGMIVPSHFVPLATPGIIRQGLMWLMNPRSPFYIRPRISVELVSWLYRFYKSSNQKHVDQASPAIKAINSYSLELFRKLDEHSELDFAFEQRGLLLICKNRKTFEEEIEMTHVARKMGLYTLILDQAGLRRQESEMVISAAGAVLYPGDAHLSPAKFVNSLFDHLKKKPNVRFITGSAIERFTMEGKKIYSVQMEKGEIVQGDEFVLAAGSASAQLVKKLDLSLPMESGKGYSLTVKQQLQKLKTPSILCEARVAITPLVNDEIRFGGTLELGGKEYKINKRRLEGIIQSVKAYFPEYNTIPLEETEPWSGLRPCPPDGLPYIGRFKQIPNLIAATGHSMMGLSLAPATGKIVADLVEDNAPAVDISEFSPDRFSYASQRERKYLLIRP